MSQEYDNTKRTKCQHRNEAERKIIEQQLSLGTSKEQIARLLGRNISTIRREIKHDSAVQRQTKTYISKRIADPGYTERQCYFVEVRQCRYETNRLRCGRKSRLLLCRDFLDYIEDKMIHEKWSPDGVVAKAKREKFFKNIVSTVTLYHWIDSRLLKERLSDHFDRIFHSITFDNGSEFAASEHFESLGLKIYYAHPYSAWERGQNEQFNGMLRRFIPKGADMASLT